MRTTRRLCTGAFIAAIFAFAPNALAQIRRNRPVPAPQPVAAEVPPAGSTPPPEPPQPPSQAEVDQLVAALQSTDFRERESATQSALKDDRFSLKVLERTLREKARDMSLEGSWRLLSIARDRFNRTPRAAMGIGFVTPYSEPRVGLKDRAIVGQTFPNFESSKVLEPGDLIIQADGQELRGPMAQPTMQSIIVSHDPGDVIPLVIRRGAAKLSLNVRLGAFADLNNTASALPSRLPPAWRFRSRGFGSQAAEPVHVKVPADEWEPNERRAQLIALRQARRIQFRDESRLPQVTGGGAARFQLPEPEEAGMGQVVVVGGAGRRQFQFGFAAPDDVSQPMTFVEELHEIALARQRELSAVSRPDDPEAAKRVAMLDRLDNAIRAEMIERGESAPDQVREPEAPNDPRH